MNAYWTAVSGALLKSRPIFVQAAGEMEAKLLKLKDFMARSWKRQDMETLDNIKPLKSPCWWLA